MTDDSGNNSFNLAEARQDAGSETETRTVDDAVRHVGPTLESEGIVADVRGTELPLGAEPPVRNAALANKDVDSLQIRSIPEDRDYRNATAREDEQITSAPAQESEPLKTRLPEDTSSDPHTDAGPDNATTAHARTGNV